MAAATRNAQAEALLAGEWFRSKHNGQLVTSGGCGRGSAINARTLRVLAREGYVRLSEGYSRQDGGNVWTAAMTERGEERRSRLKGEDA